MLLLQRSYSSGILMETYRRDCRPHSICIKTDHRILGHLKLNSMLKYAGIAKAVFGQRLCSPLWPKAAGTLFEKLDYLISHNRYKTREPLLILYPLLYSRMWVGSEPGLELSPNASEQWSSESKLVGPVYGWAVVWEFKDQLHVKGNPTWLQNMSQCLPAITAIFKHAAV